LKRKIKIGIDALGICDEGGGRTSILNYLQVITSETEDWHYIIYLSAYEPTLKKPNIKQIILPFKRGVLSRFFMQCYLPIDVFLRNIKIIHFTKGQASLVLGAKTILTIHDLTIIMHPEIHSRLSVFYWRNVQPWMARRMNAVFTVSKNTANDVIKFFKVDPKKISVIYNSSQFYNYQPNFSLGQRDILEKYGLGDEYILYVGLLALKKNLETLVRAFFEFQKNNTTIPPLILIGPRYSDSDAGYILNLITELGLEHNITYLGKVSRDDLYYIFRQATIFVFPSVHEGFGIPCLEAMELGIPVIASKNSAITEIVGDAGILLENYQSAHLWANAIYKLYNDKAMLMKLIELGRNRAQFINTKHSPKEAIKVYNQLLSN
jgi:glycosyltransferase involved in cell wall biosynthesis